MKLITSHQLNTQRAKYFEIKDINVDFGWNNYIDIICHDSISDSYDLGDTTKLSFVSEEEITFNSLIEVLKQVPLCFKERNFTKKYNSQKWLFRHLVIKFAKMIYQPTPSISQMRDWEKKLNI